MANNYHKRLLICGDLIHLLFNQTLICSSQKQNDATKKRKHKICIVTDQNAVLCLSGAKFAQKELQHRPQVLEGPEGPH